MRYETCLWNDMCIDGCMYDLRQVQVLCKELFLKDFLLVLKYFYLQNNPITSFLSTPICHAGFTSCIIINSASIVLFTKRSSVVYGSTTVDSKEIYSLIYFCGLQSWGVSVHSWMLYHLLCKQGSPAFLYHLGPWACLERGLFAPCCCSLLPKEPPRLFPCLDCCLPSASRSSLSLYFSLLWKFLSVWLGVCLADHIASEGASFVAWFWQGWAVSWDVIKALRTGCLLHRKGMLDVAGIWGCQFGQSWKLRARDSDLFFHL